MMVQALREVITRSDCLLEVMLTHVRYAVVGGLSAEPAGGTNARWA